MAEKYLGPCLWCGTHDYESNVSHIVPSAVGNAEHVLSPGEVCSGCNSYFGRDVEPILLDDPFVHIAALLRRVQNPRKPGAFRDELFDAAHPATTGVNWSLNLGVDFQPNAATFDVDLHISGRMVREYDLRRLAFLSRAVHKIGLEHLAYVFRDGSLPPELDPRSSRFDVTREWARYGQPYGKVRAVLRRPGTRSDASWHVEVWGHGDEVDLQIELFGDWYAVTLTADPANAESHLRSLTRGGANVWIIAESVLSVGVRPEATP
jgi:hypothetical protein